MASNDLGTKVLTGEEMIRDRVIRLFAYLRELTAARYSSIRNINSYDTYIWLKDIPDDKGLGCYCAWPEHTERQAADDMWVRVKKPRPKPAPAVPSKLIPWLDPTQVEDSSLDMPNLREQVVVEQLGASGADGGERETRSLNDSPDVVSLWEDYIENQWLPWAEEDRKLKSIHDIFTRLYSVYQKQQRLGETYEVVLGLGLLVWSTPSGQEVKRHLIAAQTSLSFDVARGIISLGPAGEGARPLLEQDMLETNERPGATEQTEIDGLIAGIGDDIWDNAKVTNVLRAWLNAVPGRGRLDESMVPPLGSASDPIIYMAPAIILRKRTERNLLRVFQEIMEQLRDGRAAVPQGIELLVTIAENQDRDDEERENAYSLAASVSDIYFPLEANAEQLEIANRLETRRGVLVQGPPGTGKSHTIANLICHLLATGRRILVTSHTSRALKVLKEKLPPEIAPLCVVLVGDDANGVQGLEDSIQGISSRYNYWNAAASKKNIADLERRLDAIRRQQALLLSELRAIREREIYEHPPKFGSYCGTLQTIASRVREEEHRYAWIREFFDEPVEQIESPLSSSEASDLIQLLRAINAQSESDLRKNAIDVSSIESAVDFAYLVDTERKILSAHEGTDKQRKHPSYRALLCVTREVRDGLKDALSRLVTGLESVSNHIQPWAARAAREIVADQDRAWRELLETTTEHLEVIQGYGRDVHSHRVSGLAERDLDITHARALDLLRHLDRGGRLGFGPLAAKSVKAARYLTKEVYVDGRPCDTIEALRKLVNWLEVAQHLKVLSMHWERHTSPPSGPFAAQVQDYLDLCEPLQAALDLHDGMIETRGIITAISGLPEPVWHDVQQLKALLDSLQAVTLEDELATLRGKLSTLAAKVQDVVYSPDAHSLNQQLLDAIKSRDVDAYSDICESLRNLGTLKATVRGSESLLARLRREANELAEAVASDYGAEPWVDRMSDFASAWNWNRADHFVQRLVDPGEQSRLVAGLENCSQEMHKVVATLAAEKAWVHCFARMKQEQHMALIAWSKAIKRLGKGKGVHASMHRETARKWMEICRPAIPGWIMPIYRVAESVNVKSDSFDVVIVDEASQSGPEALFLQYFAKRTVVVGDDKQISPLDIGGDVQGAEELRRQYIHDIPFSNELGLSTSFFDQADIRYGGRIRLREHFRCMPEIIQFSNTLCYSGEPLEPLRQYGLDRLTPAVIAKHVPDGYVSGSRRNLVNIPEAEAIVKQIVDCCGDKAYKGKSIGVISLLGDAQAKHIEKLLLDRLGPEEMEKRSLVCGDAYAFQGDERDIIFLSLVSAPTEGYPIATLTADRYKRRFNVAASRARDQMWLFHTATLNDLSPQCLRHRLLQYCQSPCVDPLNVEGIDVEAIRVAAANPHLDPDSWPPPFDSWLEVDVFLKIVDRGYRVIPQFEVNGQYIDLVVVGMQGRLAVECDGDRWHGPEQYESDTARQRKLERCGWKFWRIRGSSFRRDPDGSMEDLWQTLEGLKIYPGSASADIEEVHEQSPDESLYTEGQEALPSLSRAVKAAPRISEEMVDTSKPVGRPARRTKKWTRGQPVVIAKEGEPPRKFPSATAAFREILGMAPGIKAGGKLLAQRGWTLCTEKEWRASKSPKRAAATKTKVEAGRKLKKRKSGAPENSDKPMLAPYRTWKPKLLPDPQKATAPELVPGLVDIVAAEGPMPCHRAYRLYAEAAGMKGVDKQTKPRFDKAVWRAEKLGLLEEANEYTNSDQAYMIVRKLGTPPVLLRKRGTRAFDEIPPSEVALLMGSLLAINPAIADRELFQVIAQAYELDRLSMDTLIELRRIKSGLAT